MDGECEMNEPYYQNSEEWTDAVYAEEVKPTSKKNVASFVTGLISVLLHVLLSCCCGGGGLVSFVLSIVAIVLSNKHKKAVGTRGKLGVAGLVLGIIGLVISIILFVMYIISLISSGFTTALSFVPLLATIIGGA